MAKRLKMLLLAGLLLAIGTEASGQQRVIPRYTPRRSTVSPYLNLTRADVGGVPNYYAFVRPFQEQRRFDEVMLRSMREQRRVTDTLQKEYLQPTVRPTGKAGWFMLDSERSRYQDDSHYYGQWQSSRGRRGGR